jgi:putative ABC transport system permease protein
MKTWIVRVARWAVPADWREPVVEDLQESAQAEHRSAVWIAWQCLRAGFRLRIALTIDSLRFDIQHVAAALVRARWFACGAVLTFALGIGVNVAVFTAVDRVLFRQLPYERPDELVVMQELDPGRPGMLAGPMLNGRALGTIATPLLEGVRSHSGFVGLSMAWFTGGFLLSRDSDEAPLRLTAVTHNTLSVFGVRVLRGRDFTDDDATRKHRLALISYNAWQRRFGGVADVIGRQLWSNAVAIEIVGVLPPSFIPASTFLDPTSDGLVLDPSLDLAHLSGARQPPPYLRLRSGVGIEAAQAELDGLVAAVTRDTKELQGARLRLTPLRSALFEGYVNYLWLIAAAASLLLAIACANLGSLMVVRNRSRAHHTATQIALGAPAWRLMRAGLLESALLSIVGAIVSVVVIGWSDAALRAMLPPIFSRYSATVMDPRVLIFALLTVALCVVVAGVYPSWRLARVNVLDVLQRGNVSARSGRLTGGRTLLIVEAALAVMLVAAAAVSVRSFAGLAMTDLGFTPAELYNVTVAAPRDPRPDAEYLRSLQVVDVLSAVPSVVAAGAADINPLTGALPMSRVAVGANSIGQWQVTAGFFTALRLQVVSGRVLSADEIARDAPVVVLSESALRLALPDVTTADAVGKTLRLPNAPEREIVGIVRDLRSSHAARVSPALYVPLVPKGFRIAMFVMRMAPGAVPSVRDLRGRLAERGVTVSNVTVQAANLRLGVMLSDQRFRAVLFSAFGVTALILAALGLYAVSAYDAAQRRREVGIRVAIGSSATAVQWLIVRQTLAPVIAGIAIGLAGAYWAARFVQAFLHQVDARDPGTLAIVSAVLLIATAAAAWLPAYRASHLDPSSVLRVQ